MRRIILFSLLMILCFPAASLAHSGGTDASGGHNSSSGYHYHHGYPAHIHYHNICPYDVAEIAYDTEYPWEYDSFLDEYVDGFDCGYDIGAFHGEDDGYAEYHKNKDLFNPWTEYEDYDYPQQSPYAYGYCDGYRFGYCIEFEETYNDEASYYDEYYEKYYDPEIEEVWLYADYETDDTSNNTKTENTELYDSTDVSIYNSVEENPISDTDNSLLHKIKAFFVEPANDVGDSKAVLLLLSLVCLSVIIIIIGGLISLVGYISSSNKIENFGKKISTIGCYGLSVPIWIIIFVPMFIFAIPSFIMDLFSKNNKKS